MRTHEEIQNELNGKGHVNLSEEESVAFEAICAVADKTIFLSYSETVTQGDQTITKTSSGSFPADCDPAGVLLMLKVVVRDRSDIQFS